MGVPILRSTIAVEPSTRANDSPSPTEAKVNGGIYGRGNPDTTEKDNVDDDDDELEGIGRKEGGWGRKWGIVRAVGSKHWHECDDSVYRCAEPDTPNHGEEDTLVDIAQKNDEAGKEEEQREV
jgi:hypothetical protein